MSSWAAQGKEMTTRDREQDSINYYKGKNGGEEMHMAGTAREKWGMQLLLKL
jgi:hypothetical protein